MKDYSAYVNKEVRVEWRDSYGVQTGWQPADGVFNGDLTVTSWGRVLRVSDTVIMLAHNYAPETVNTSEQVNGVMAIPVASITRIQIMHTDDDERGD